MLMGNDIEERGLHITCVVGSHTFRLSMFYFWKEQIRKAVVRE